MNMSTYFGLITFFLFNIFTCFYPAISQTLSDLKPDLLSQSYQQQETSISLNENELNSPIFLSLKASSVTNTLQAKIQINGEIIRKVSFPNMVIVDLSSYLHKGKNTVLITGKYSPANSSVTINLEGNSSSVTQTTRGNGQIQQILTIYVN